MRQEETGTLCPASTVHQRRHFKHAPTNNISSFITFAFIAFNCSKLLGFCKN